MPPFASRRLNASPRERTQKQKILEQNQLYGAKCDSYCCSPSIGKAMPIRSKGNTYRSQNKTSPKPKMRQLAIAQSLPAQPTSRKSSAT